MYLSNYKNDNILIWVFSSEIQQAPRFRGNYFCHAPFLSCLVLVRHSFGYTPVLRAACYGRRVTGSVLRAERSAAALRFARNKGGANLLNPAK